MTLAPAEAGPLWLLELPPAEQREYLAALPPQHRSNLQHWIRAQTPWRTSPVRLRKKLDPTTVVTPALQLIDRAIVETITAPPPAAGGIKGLIVSMPPQEGKTTAVTRGGCEWALQRDPNTRIGLVSYELNVIRRVSRFVRADIQHFNGRDGRVDLGLRLRPGEASAAEWNLADARGGVYATGISGALTSVPLDGMFIDDPVKDYKTADSLLVSEQTWVWWLSVGRPRLAPGGWAILVLTRWSDLDLAGRLEAEQEAQLKESVDNRDEWRVVNIPAQCEDEATDPLGRKVGEWLESARGRTTAQWEATKRTTLTSGGSRSWAALYQGHPAPKEGGEIKRAWFRYETELPADDAVDEWVSSWDMKLKEKRTGDYQAGGVFARVGSHIYLMDLLRGQWDFATIQAAVALAAVRWPHVHRHLIENTGNGPEVMEQLRKPMPDYEVSDDVAGELKMTAEERLAVTALRRRGMAGLVPENPKGSKVSRIRAYLGVIESGHFHLPARSTWGAEYVDEMAGFGVGGTHDDQVDMTSQALRRLARRGAKSEEEEGLQVPQGRVPPTPPPSGRRPGVGRIPPTSRQAAIVKRQLDRRPKG